MSCLRILVTLSLVLALPLLTHAKPKPKAAPAVPHAALMQQLTPEERACRAGGFLVQLIAVDRDALVPLTTTLAHLRILLATSSAQSAQVIVEIAQMLYETPEMSGAWTRQAFETACLRPTMSVDEARSPQPWR